MAILTPYAYQGTRTRQVRDGKLGKLARWWIDFAMKPETT